MVYFLTDHKTGTWLAGKLIPSIPVPVRHLVYYRFWHGIDPEDRYVVFMRHPYEVITSGYNYHMRCEEKWAVTDANMLQWWAENHFTPESVEANRHVIDAAWFSRPRPYREMLNMMPPDVGLAYEMTHVGRMTVNAMYEYPNYGLPNVMTLRMEDLLDDFDGTTRRMLDFVGSPETDLSMHDVRRMRRSEVAADSHITNKSRRKNSFERQWKAGHYALAKAVFPDDLLEKLGYAEKHTV